MKKFLTMFGLIGALSSAGPVSAQMYPGYVYPGYAASVPVQQPVVAPQPQLVAGRPTTMTVAPVGAYAPVAATASVPATATVAARPVAPSQIPSVMTVAAAPSVGMPSWPAASTAPGMYTSPSQPGMPVPQPDAGYAMTGMTQAPPAPMPSGQPMPDNSAQGYTGTTTYPGSCSTCPTGNCGGGIGGCMPRLGPPGPCYLPGAYGCGWGAAGYAPIYGGTYGPYAGMGCGPAGCGLGCGLLNGGGAGGCASGNCGGGCATGNCGPAGCGTSLAPAPVMMNGCGDGCSPCCVGPSCFASVGAMIMSINQVNSHALAYQSCYCSELLNARDPLSNQWQGGYQLSIGRVINCNNAIQATFWWINPFSQTVSTVGNANAINTGLDFTTGAVTNFNNGYAANAYFQGSQSQSIWRSTNIYNFEVNLLHQPLISPSARYGILGLAGVRWLHIGDGFNYTAIAGTGVPALTGQSATYSVRTINDLVGFQIGARCHYYVKPNVRIFAIPTMGIYGNAIQANQALTAAGGATALNYNGTAFASNSFLGGFSTIGQIDAGGSWQLTPRFSVFALYRVLGVTGVALSTNQIPQYMADLHERAKVNNNGDMIIHGAMVGGQYAF